MDYHPFGIPRPNRMNGLFSSPTLMFSTESVHIRRKAIQSSITEVHGMTVFRTCLVWNMNYYKLFKNVYECCCWNVLIIIFSISKPKILERFLDSKPVIFKARKSLRFDALRKTSLLEFSLTWGISFNTELGACRRVVTGCSHGPVSLDVNLLDLGRVYSTRALTIVFSAAKGWVNWTIMENTYSTAVVINVLVII